jgi:hypothetical protein
MSPFLSPGTREALEQLIQLDADPASDPVERLRRIRAALAALETDSATLASVRDALREGATWDTIATAAGVKPAAAKWRWQGTDEEIDARHEAGRKRAVRPSSVPTDLPGYSVSDAARKLGVTPQAIYLQITRGKLSSRTVELDDGRSYKRVFLDGDDAQADGAVTGPA